MNTLYFYALSDTFTGDDPSDYTHGFANTKCVIAFRRKKDRNVWLRSTHLLTAKAITRNEAVKITPWEKGEYHGFSCQYVKPVRVYNSPDFIFLKKSEN
jgi:hypothetical protein